MTTMRPTSGGFGKGSARLIIGILIAFAGTALTAWAIKNVMEIGTCATGSAFQSVRECPSGTTTYIFAIFGGVILAIAGAFIAGLAGFIISFVFLGVGIGSLLAGRSDSVTGSFPTWFGAIFVAGACVPFVLLLMGRGRQRKAQRLVQTGRPAVGTVLSVQDTGVTVNENPRVRIRFRIDPQDGAPSYEADKTTTVSRVSVPRPGERYPVWIDPADPDTFAFGMAQTAEAARQVKEQFGIDVGQAGAEEPSGYGGGFASDRAAGSGVDPVAQIQQLDKLRRSGAISEEEYQKLKEKILGS